MVSIRSLFTSALAMLAVPVMGALTPQQIADGIKDLTSKSEALQPVAQSITILNAPLIIIGQGPFPQLITGFTDIVTSATDTIGLFPGTQSIANEADANIVFNAFREFVRVHQALFNILIGKAKLVETVPVVGQPVAAVLRQVENVIDTIAITLINTVEPKVTELQSQANSLGNTLDIVIQKYEGLSLRKRGSKVFVA